MQKLDELREKVASCEKCELCKTRTNTVFGEGNPAAEIMIIGEAPGANEDETGRPFVGRAGQLLDKMLLGAGFSRNDNLYIANMIKCRPPKNRDPLESEIEMCIDYLRTQVKIIAPKIIVCAGRIAAQSIIDKNFKVTKQHGEFIKKGDILFMGTYHPSALLRFPGNKEAAFADLLALRDQYESLRN